MDFITNIPPCLKRIKNPPKKLYFKGDLSLLERPKVAIVGSRACSKYTQNLILSLASALKNAGVCVVSGAAIGADIYAHQGAYPLTIAVFGNGLDEIYPKQNAKMINEIYTRCLALSEYEPSQKAHSAFFLQRNRIVVGLSDAVVVAQADIKSGSMSSAMYAKNAGIGLYGFGQRMGESDGTNLLISKGQMSLIADIDEFVSKFSSTDFPVNKEQNKDELLEFIKQNPSFNVSYARFGDKIFEYEVEGKIAIDGAFVRAL